MEKDKEMTDQINFKDHPFVGVEWPVTGSKGDQYTVVMHNKGFSCDCPAYVKCKHIKGVEAGILGENFENKY